MVAFSIRFEATEHAPHDHRGVVQHPTFVQDVDSGWFFWGISSSAGAKLPPCLSHRPHRSVTHRVYEVDFAAQSVKFAE